MWYSVTKLRVFGAEDVLFFVGLIPARSQAEPGLARLDKSLFTRGEKMRRGKERLS